MIAHAANRVSCSSGVPHADRLADDYGPADSCRWQTAALDELWLGQATEAAPLPPVVQGAGFGAPEQNRKVEKAAIRHVTDGYQSEGYEVTSVEAARCGWDLTVTRGSEELHLEVKGVGGSLVRFFLTANEHKTALGDPNWLLLVVTYALGEPAWYELDGPTAACYAEPALYQLRIPTKPSPG